GARAARAAAGLRGSLRRESVVMGRQRAGPLAGVWGGQRVARFPSLAGSRSPDHRQRAPDPQITAGGGPVDLSPVRFAWVVTHFGVSPFPVAVSLEAFTVIVTRYSATFLCLFGCSRPP